MSSKQLRWGVVGHLGHWGKNILKSLDSLNFEIGGLYDLSEPNAIDQLETVIENSDVLIVAVPPENHFEIAKKCLESGKHTWVEKPLTLDLKDADKLLDLAAKHKKILHVDHTWVYDKHIRFIDDCLKLKCFGKVLTANISWKNWGKFQPCGVFNDLFSHILAISFKLWGCPNYINAFGTQEDNVFQSGEIILNYRDKFKVNCHISWLSNEKIRNLEIITDKGILVTDFTGTVEFIDRKNKKKIFKLPDIGSPLEVQLLHFEQCILNNQETFSNGKTAARIVEILGKVEQSARASGSEIRL